MALNQMTSPGMATALDRFREAYPDFDTTAALDELRATEYVRLDALGHTYLDYTAAVYTPRRSCASTRKCSPRPCLATRIRKACPRGR
jgi:hypothetical protein